MVTQKEIDECNAAMDSAAKRIEAWSQSPEGQDYRAATWEKYKASMIERGLVPGPDKVRG